MKKKKENIRDGRILVAIQTELKEKFAIECSKDFITMSSKINQFISEYLTAKELNNKLIVEKLDNYYNTDNEPKERINLLLPKRREQ